MTVPKRTKRAKPDPELVKLADSLLTNYKKPEDLIGENGLLKQLTKMLVERALEAEMSEHLGHDKSQAITNASGNAVFVNEVVRSIMQLDARFRLRWLAPDPG